MSGIVAMRAEINAVANEHFTYDISSQYDTAQ